MALKSFVIDDFQSKAPDIDCVPVRVWLGGKGLSLVTTDERNADLLADLGFFVMEAMACAMACGQRFARVDEDGGMPRYVEQSELRETEIWNLEEFEVEPAALYA